MLILRLEFLEVLKEFPEIDRETNYDENYDDVDSVINDLCVILAETKTANFRVGGFGQEDWGTDVEIDLATILEQLPEVLSSLYQGDYPFILDFYEQGIERSLTFEKKPDGSVGISCISRTNWIPKPSYIIMNEDDIKTQILELANSFIAAVRIVSPRLSSNPLFEKWRNKLTLR